MEEILFAILQFLFEVALQLLSEYLWHAAKQALLKPFLEIMDISGPSKGEGLSIEAVGYALVGALFGGLSLLVFSHPLMHSTHFHGISLLLSPLAMS